MHILKLNRILERGDDEDFAAAIQEISEEITSVSASRFKAQMAESRLAAQIERIKERSLRRKINRICDLIIEGNPCAYQPTDISGLCLTRHERDVAHIIAENGWRILRNGWPDFLIPIGKRAFAIEVKLPGEEVRPNQAEMHIVLENLGVPVIVAHSPEGLRRRLGRLDVNGRSFLQKLEG